MDSAARRAPLRVYDPIHATRVWRPKVHNWRAFSWSSLALALSRHWTAGLTGLTGFELTHSRSNPVSGVHIAKSGNQCPQSPA